jgi:hypothetical protein
MSTTYIQLDMPITQIHCLDEAIKASGGTWNRPQILIQIEQARENLTNADNTVNLIQANHELALLLEKLVTSEPLDSISFTVNGVNVSLTRTNGRYRTSVASNRGVNVPQIRSCMSIVQSNYHKGVKEIEGEISATLKRLEEQKDILSSEQLEMERMRIQNEKMALDNANKQRVVEVTKELEEKLSARGFEIRKRMIGKKIVYQAVRR